MKTQRSVQREVQLSPHIANFIISPVSGLISVICGHLPRVFTPTDKRNDNTTGRSLPCFDEPQNSGRSRQGSQTELSTAMYSLFGFHQCGEEARASDNTVNLTCVRWNPLLSRRVCVCVCVCAKLKKKKKDKRNDLRVALSGHQSLNPPRASPHPYTLPSNSTAAGVGGRAVECLGALTPCCKRMFACALLCRWFPTTHSNSPPPFFLSRTLAWLHALSCARARLPLLPPSYRLFLTPLLSNAFFPPPQLWAYTLLAGRHVQICPYKIKWKKKSHSPRRPSFPSQSEEILCKIKSPNRCAWLSAMTANAVLREPKAEDTVNVSEPL